MLHLEYKYRNNLKGWRWVAWFSIVIFIIYVLLFMYRPYWKIGLIFMLSYLFVLYALPILFFDIRYYLRNGGQTIDILDDRLILTTKDGERKEYLFSEVEEVLRHGYDKSFTGHHPTAYYGSLKFVFKDTDEPPVYITCFMHPNFSEVTEEVRRLGLNVH